MITITGQFERGEVARVRNNKGQLIAKGLASYSSADLVKIAGIHSKDISSTLGHDYGSEVIHRDDLVVIQE